MEDKASGLFVNDGSFMERFRKLQEENKHKEATEEPKSGISLSSSMNISRSGSDSRVNVTKKPATLSSGGKLAFSLKQKPKVAAPLIKFVADEDEDEADAKISSYEGQPKRQKLNQPVFSETSSSRAAGVPSPPTNPEVKKVADKLASFVAKNGRQFEQITRQKNPGDTPFKFLFDQTSHDYKYYEYRLLEEEKALLQKKDSQPIQAVQSAPSRNQRHLPDSVYQTSAAALYESEGSGEGSTSTDADPIAVMEFYMKKAAQEERTRQPKQSKDEMPPPASLQAPLKKGHHMGDYIPPEELAKFLASCNDAAARKAAVEAAERNKIQADNVGHKLLSKMGWKEGEGLGSSRSGRSDPVMAGSVKQDTLGVGASKPGEVTTDDDIYEQYKKRMMLGYRYRPNPLNNPRKAYY